MKAEAEQITITEENNTNKATYFSLIKELSLFINESENSYSEESLHSLSEHVIQQASTIDEEVILVLLAKKLKCWSMELLNLTKRDFFHHLFLVFVKKILKKRSDITIDKLDLSFNLAMPILTAKDLRDSGVIKEIKETKESDDVSRGESFSSEKETQILTQEDKQTGHSKVLEFFDAFESVYNIKSEMYKKVFNDFFPAKKATFPLFEQYLIYFPEYFSLLKSTLTVLFEEDSYLPMDWKYFIAIMGAATVKCDYFVSFLEEEFLLRGGQLEWIICGLKASPKPLQLLGKLNNILAHQPWKLSMFDFNTLLNQEEASWNLNSLVQAFLLMTTFQKLAAFINAVGIKTKSEDPVDIYNIIRDLEIARNEEKRKKFEQMGKSKNYPNYSTRKKLDDYPDYKCYLRPNRQSSSSDKKKEVVGNASTLTKIKDFFDDNLKKYTSSYCTSYQDFSQSNDIKLNYLVFNYQDHALEILNDVNDTSTQAINNEFDYILNLSWKDDKSKSDRFSFREAVACYIESILGYHHDEYNYASVNLLILISQKKIIKKIACSSHDLIMEEIEEAEKCLSKEEILHIILIVTTVKQRLQMIYFANYLNDFIRKMD